MGLILMTLCGAALLGAAVFVVVCLMFRNVISDNDSEKHPAAKKLSQDIYYCNYNFFDTIAGRKLDVVMAKQPNGEASVTITEAEDWTAKEKVERYKVNESRFDRILAIVDRFEMTDWERTCPRNSRQGDPNEIMVQIQGIDGSLYCDDSHMPKGGQNAFCEILETMTQNLTK